MYSQKKIFYQSLTCPQEGKYPTSDSFSHPVPSRKESLYALLKITVQGHRIARRLKLITGLFIYFPSPHILSPQYLILDKGTREYNMTDIVFQEMVGNNWISTDKTMNLNPVFTELNSKWITDHAATVNLSNI